MKRTANQNDIKTLAKIATFGTLKRIHAASGNNRIASIIRNLHTDCYYMENAETWSNDIADYRKERKAINADISRLKREKQAALDSGNIERAQAINILLEGSNTMSITGLYEMRDSLTTIITDLEKYGSYSVSDSYDLLQSAQVFFMEKIGNGDMLIVDDTDGKFTIIDSAENTIYCKKRKDGKNGKKRNMLQAACALVRHEIYSNRGIMEGSSNYTYLADMAINDNDGNTETIEQVADRVYIRSGKWYDMPSISDYETQAALLARLNLTETQAVFVHYRLQGLSCADIARKRDISRKAVHKTQEQCKRIVRDSGLFDNDTMAIYDK